MSDGPKLLIEEVPWDHFDVVTCSLRRLIAVIGLGPSLGYRGGLWVARLTEYFSLIAVLDSFF